MANQQGQNIQVKLLIMRKTQRWLHKQLLIRGYTLSEQLLSKILNGKYTYKCAAEIIAVSEKIIDEHLQKNDKNEAV